MNKCIDQQFENYTMPITIDPHVCLQNHRCPIIKACPLGAISQDGYGLPIIDESKCAELHGMR
jgi:Fe-S-cluster-containing hydrogenase component 2